MCVVWDKFYLVALCIITMPQTAHLLKFVQTQKQRTQLKHNELKKEKEIEGKKTKTNSNLLLIWKTRFM